MNQSKDQRRMFGICAHVDAGKTTLTERLLYIAKRIRKMGEVHFGESQMDWMSQERERGITIQSAATFFSWQYNGNIFDMNLIDTPGHVDFTIEVSRSMRILDGAVLVLDGVLGVEPQTRTVWKQAERAKVPLICLINKMDRQGSDYWHCYRTLCKSFSQSVFVPVLVPESNDFRTYYELIRRIKHNWSESGIHTAIKMDRMPEEMEKARAETMDYITMWDPVLSTRYESDQNSITEEEALNELRNLVRKRCVFPVMSGSGFKNVGVNLILDSICELFPSPEESGKLIVRNNFSCLIFKVQHLPGLGMVYYARIYSGSITPNSNVYNLSDGKKYRIGRIIRMHAISMTDVKEAFAGDLVAFTGSLSVRTGDTLSYDQNISPLEPIEIPASVVSVSISPKAQTISAYEKMADALRLMTLQDPSLVYVPGNHNEGKEHILKGMGELHLDITKSVLHDIYSLETIIGKPKVEYRCSLREQRDIEYTFKRQTGGSGLWARIFVKFTPTWKDGMNITFEDKVVGGKIPNEMIPAVNEGIIYESGVGVGAYPALSGFHALLYDGLTHPVDSKKKAFELAARYALREAAENNMIIFEPIMKLTVDVDGDYIGKVVSDISSRRGVVLEMNRTNNLAQVIAEVPLATMFGYVDSLRSITSGSGTASYEFSRYSEVPTNLVENILKELNKSHSTDE